MTAPTPLDWLTFPTPRTARCHLCRQTLPVDDGDEHRLALMTTHRQDRHLDLYRPEETP